MQQCCLIGMRISWLVMFGCVVAEVFKIAVFIGTWIHSRIHIIWLCYLTIGIKYFMILSKAFFRKTFFYINEIVLVNVNICVWGDSSSANGHIDNSKKNEAKKMGCKCNGFSSRTPITFDRFSTEWLNCTLFRMIF